MIKRITNNKQLNNSQFNHKQHSNLKKQTQKQKDKNKSLIYSNHRRKKKLSRNRNKINNQLIQLYLFLSQTKNQILSLEIKLINLEELLNKKAMVDLMQQHQLNSNKLNNYQHLMYLARVHNYFKEIKDRTSLLHLVQLPNKNLLRITNQLSEALLILDCRKNNNKRNNKLYLGPIRLCKQLNLDNLSLD